MAKNKDLTRIEDLHEFVHEKDEEADELLKADNDDSPFEEDELSTENTFEEMPYSLETSSEIESLGPESFENDEEDGPSQVLDEGQWESQNVGEDSQLLTDDNRDESSIPEDLSENVSLKTDEFHDENSLVENMTFEETDSSQENNPNDSALNEENDLNEEDIIHEDMSFEYENENENIESSSEDNTNENISFEKNEISEVENQNSDMDFEEKNLDKDNFLEPDHFNEQQDRGHEIERPPDLPSRENSLQKREYKERMDLSPPPSRGPQLTKTEDFSERSFNEVRIFGENLIYGKIPQGGSPPFSILIKNIQYQEDADSIFTILEQHEIITDENKKIIEQGLKNGHLLISQLGEYSAIFLAHKLRKFHSDVILGLSDKIRSSDKTASNGPVSKRNIRQNFGQYHVINVEKINKKSIILSTSSKLDNYTIKDYIEVIGRHILVDRHEINEVFHNKHQYPERNQNFLSEEEESILKEIENLKRDSSLQSKFILIDETQKVYKKLTELLREEAYKLKANAVIDIRFQISSLLASKNDIDNQKIYQITCTGNAVWIE